MTKRLSGVLLACLLAAGGSLGARQSGGSSFDSNGVPIHYVDRGRGEAVVLIHGFTGSQERHFGAPGIIGALETAGYRAIALDCRGHGQSGKPTDPAQYGLEMVRDVVRLLDHLKIDRAHIVGYSMGGAIANQVLIQYPKRVASITLVGAGWAGEDLGLMKSQLQALADGFAKKDASALIRGVTAGQAPPTDAEIAALNAALFARNDPDALAAVARGMISLLEVPASSLRAVKVPIQAIVGEHDASNVESVKRMTGVVPKFAIVEIPGATHSTSVRLSAPHIVAFLNRQRTGG